MSPDPLPPLPPTRATPSPARCASLRNWCGSSGALVYLLDIFPTVCELAGAPPVRGIDGVSFAPVLAGKSKVARAELFLAYRGVQRAIRDERWKLIRYPQVDVTQLFDLQNDPDELHDLASDPAHAAQRQRLLERLQAAQKHYADAQPLTVPNPKPAKWTPPSAEELAKAKAAKKAEKKK